MRLFCILFSLLVYAKCSFAEHLLLRDSSFIASFNRKISLRLFLGSRHTEFSIRPNGNLDTLKNGSIVYKPNVGFYIGVGATYRHTGINLSVRIPYSSRDVEKYGDTKYTDLRLLAYGVHYGGQVYYKKYSGFYISNPQNIFTDWISGSPYPQRSDITLENVGMELYYVFNKNQFSLRSVFRQTEMQIKNAQSFLLMAEASALTIFGNTSLIPGHLDKYYGNMKGLSSGNFMIFGALAGYTRCNVVKKNYFFSPTLLIGPAYFIRNYNVSAGEISRNDLGAKVNFKLSAGYNSYNIYLGFIFDTDSDILREREMKLTTSVFSINFFVGYRLKEKRLKYKY